MWHLKAIFNELHQLPRLRIEGDVERGGGEFLLWFFRRRHFDDDDVVAEPLISTNLAALDLSQSGRRKGGRSNGLSHWMRRTSLKLTVNSSEKFLTHCDLSILNTFEPNFALFLHGFAAFCRLRCLLFRTGCCCCSLLK